MCYNSTILVNTRLTFISANMTLNKTNVRHMQKSPVRQLTNRAFNISILNSIQSFRPASKNEKPKY